MVQWVCHFVRSSGPSCVNVEPRIDYAPPAKNSLFTYLFLQVPKCRLLRVTLARELEPRSILLFLIAYIYYTSLIKRFIDQYLFDTVQCRRCW